MDYKLHTLPTGLRILTVPMPSLESVTLTVWVKTGSRFEEKKVNGISHFLEHMVFKGSRKRPSAKAISEAVDAIGGEFNAATSKDWTNFFIKARTANLEIAFDVLSDMVLNPLLKPEEIEREKGVICEEIAMYEDTPLMKINDVFEQTVFEGSSLGWDIAGDEKSVRGITQNDFLLYRKKYYHPENMLISVVGGIVENKAIELTERYFRKFGIRNSKFEIKPNFQNKQTKSQFKLKTKKTDQAHFILGFLADAREYRGRYAQGLLATILGGGMSSRLFIEVRERRGLAYSVKTGVERYQDTGYLATYAGVDPGKVEEAVKVILDQHDQIANRRLPVAAGELKKAKEYLKGHLALALEDTKSVTGFYADQVLFLKKVISPEDVFKKIDAVSLDEIYFEAKRLFTPSRLNLAVIGSYNDESKFRKLL